MNLMEPTLETDVYGIKRWSLNGKRHRVDGPAVIYPDGTEWWCLNGKRHRLDGPAVTFINGYTEFWAFGVRYGSLDELIVDVIMTR